jgi:tRNA G10  N-methylase Trm11
MDAELSLITANMALAAPGKLFFDPFVGTGSFIEPILVEILVYTQFPSLFAAETAAINVCTQSQSPESLITANMALAAPGKLFFDPFVGTGSFIVAASHFGALTSASMEVVLI